MSFTQIITASGQNQSHLVERLRSEQPIDPQSFLHEMSTSPLFATDEQQLIQDLVNDYDEEMAPSILILFLSDIVKPALLKSDNEAAFLRIIDTVKKLLLSILPKGIDVDSFIQESTRQSDCDFELSEELTKINALFQKIEEILFQKGDKINENIESNFEKLKERLSKIIDLKEKLSEEFHTRHFSQTERVDRLSDELANISLAFQVLGTSHLDNQSKYKELLGRCHDLFRHIK